MPQQIQPVASHRVTTPIEPVASHAREQRHITPKGKVIYLPDDVSEEEAAQAVEDSDAMSERSTLADLGIGAAKNLGRTLLDMTQVFQPANSLSLGMSSRVPQLQPENATQTVGGFIPDLVMSAAGTPAAARAVRAGANWLERGAVPMSKAAADYTLKSGAGSVAGSLAEKNAAKLAEAAAAKTYTLPSGVTKPIVGQKPYVQEAADAMAKAVGTPARPFWEDFAIGGGAYALGGPELAKAIMIAKVLSRPGVKSTIAQGTYSAAPALGASGAGAAGPIVRQLLDWLGGQNR